MKAFLLAAGKGTRLQPLTFHIPKCLVPINGKPLIEYWFDLFELYGIKEILINTHHLSEKVKEYVSKHSRNLKIKLTYEDKLLGSGGTIKKNWDFVKDEELFFIFYADNLTNLNLEKMLKFHKEKKRNFTLALFKVSNPQECGIVSIDKDSCITSFSEKPKNPTSNLAFAGIMLSDQSLINFFPTKEIFDLGYDVLPKIAGRASGYIMNDYLLDIGTFQRLKQAEKDVKNNVFIL